MSAFSDYLEHQLGEATLRGSTYAGGPVYFAICTANPTDSANDTEVTDSAYERQQAHVSAVSDGFVNEGGGVFANGNSISFPAIVDDQVTVTHWALFDAKVGGNMLYHAELTNAKTLDPDDVLNFPEKSVTVTLS